MAPLPMIFIFVLDGPKIIFKTTEPTNWVIYTFMTKNALEALNITFDVLNMHQNNEAIFDQVQGRKMIIYFEYPEELVELLDDYPLTCYTNIHLELLDKLHHSYFVEILTLIKKISLPEHEEGSSNTDLTENNNSQQENRDFRFGPPEGAEDFCDDKNNNKNDITIVVLADERMAGQLANLTHLLYEAQLVSSISIGAATVYKSSYMRQPNHSKSTASNKQYPEASHQSKKTKETTKEDTSNLRQIGINSSPETTILRKPVARRPMQKEETENKETTKEDIINGKSYPLEDERSIGFNLPPETTFPRNPEAGSSMSEVETDLQTEPKKKSILDLFLTPDTTFWKNPGAGRQMYKEEPKTKESEKKLPTFPRNPGAGRPMRKQETDVSLLLPNIGNQGVIRANQGMTHSTNLYLNEEPVMLYQVEPARPQAQSVHSAAASTYQPAAWLVNHPLPLYMSNPLIPGNWNILPPSLQHTDIQAEAARNIPYIRSNQAQSVHMAAASTNQNAETGASTVNHPLSLYNPQIPGYWNILPPTLQHTDIQAEAARNIPYIRSNQSQSVHLAAASTNQNSETGAWTVNHSLPLYNPKIPDYWNILPPISQHTDIEAGEVRNIPYIRSNQAQSVYLAGASSKQNAETDAWTVNRSLSPYNQQIPSHRNILPPTLQHTGIQTGAASNIPYIRSNQAQSVHLAAASTNQNAETEAWTVNHPVSLNNPQIPGYGENQPHTPQQRDIQAGAARNIAYIRSNQAQSVHLAAASTNQNAETETWTVNHPLSLNNPQIPGYGENHPHTQQQRDIQAGAARNIPHIRSNQAQSVSSSEYAVTEALRVDLDREIQDWVVRNISILMTDVEEIVASFPAPIAAWAPEFLFSIMNNVNTTQGS